MTGDGGLVLMICGALSLLISMTERAVSHHRWLAASITTTLDPALRAAFPPPPVAHDLERLAIEAEAVLESQEIVRRQQRWRR